MSARALVAAAWLVPALAFAMSPFEKNHPLVDEGTRAYENQQFEEALSKFEAAAKDRPQDARVHYNRGLALHKLGRNDDAKAAFTRALEADAKGELASKIHYNLGTIAASENQREQAIREYRAALKKDPGDELARHNLEVLLKNVPPKQNQGQDGGAPDGGSGDGGKPDAGQDGGVTDGGSDAGRPDGGAPDGGGGDGGSQADGGQDGGVDGGGQGDGGQGDGGRGDGGEGEQEQQGDGGQGEQSDRGDGGTDGGAEAQDGGPSEPTKVERLPDGGVDLSKQEAEKLLDSLKSNEKNLQLWRFRQKTKNSERHGKDW